MLGGHPDTPKPPQPLSVPPQQPPIYRSLGAPCIPLRQMRLLQLSCPPPTLAFLPCHSTQPPQSAPHPSTCVSKFPYVSTAIVSDGSLSKSCVKEKITKWGLGGLFRPPPITPRLLQNPPRTMPKNLPTEPSGSIHSQAPKMPQNPPEPNPQGSPTSPDSPDPPRAPNTSWGPSNHPHLLDGRHHHMLHRLLQCHDALDMFCKGEMGGS